MKLHFVNPYGDERLLISDLICFCNLFVCQLCLYLTSFFVSGHYSPERSGKSVFRSSPAYSLSARSQEVSTNQTPGNTLCWLYLRCGICVWWRKEHTSHLLFVLQVQPPTLCPLCWGPKLWSHVLLLPIRFVAAAKLAAFMRTWKRYIYIFMKTISLNKNL